MLAELLKEIRGLEEKADEIRRRAHVESRRIIQEAEQKAAELVAQSIAAAEEEGRKIIAAAEEEAQNQALLFQERTAEQINSLVAAARARQEKAISMVMERIVKSYGYS